MTNNIHKNMCKHLKTQLTDSTQSYKYNLEIVGFRKPRN